MPPNELGECIEDYEVLDLLGRGGFACVYRARCRRTGFMVAIKMIDRSQMNAARMGNRVLQEVTIHAKLKHPSILQLFTFFEDINYVYLVLELAHHGELQGYLRENNKRLTEIETASVMRQVVQGLLYLHSRNIIHRDMSLSNLLLTKDFQIKIADFGLATTTGPEEKHRTLCGTPNYISPEVASRAVHGQPTDVWGIGCMLYTLLIGTPPFDTGGVKSTLMKVVTSSYVVPSYLSYEAKDLIDRLLQKNPINRIRLNEILAHPFMTRCSTDHHVTVGSADSGILTTMSSSGTSNNMTTTSKIHRSRSEERYMPSHKFLKKQPAILTELSPHSSLHQYAHAPSPEYMDFKNNFEHNHIESFDAKNPNQSNFSDNVLEVLNDYNRPADPGGGSDCAHFNNNQENIFHGNSNFVPLFAKTTKSSETESVASTNQRINVTPFKTDRLLPTRHKTKNAILTIDQNGEVIFELIKYKIKFNEERVVDVCRISKDGLRIVVYQPDAGRGVKIQNVPPEIPPSGASSVYTYENLPQKHWNKYIYASRFIQLVRNKTPKVTYYSSLAKCQLMETLEDFEVTFYDGQKMVQSKDGNIQLFDVDGHLIGTSPNETTKPMWEHFQLCFQNCITFEKTFSNIHIDGECFPITIGRRPPMAPSQGRGVVREIDTNAVMLTPRTSNMPSFAMSLSSASSAPTSSHPVQSKQNTKRIKIPGIGIATQSSEGILHVDYTDGSQISVYPKEQGGRIKYIPCGSLIPLHYTTNDCLPELVRMRLEQMPQIVKQLIMQKDQGSGTPFQPITHHNSTPLRYLR